jgi:hypothetical protein
LLIPNTVAIVRGGPNPGAAQTLFEYLQQAGVVNQLISQNALEGKTVAEMILPTVNPDWNSLLRDLDLATTELKQIFLR